MQREKSETPLVLRSGLLTTLCIPGLAFSTQRSAPTSAAAKGDKSKQVWRLPIPKFKMRKEKNKTRKTGGRLKPILGRFFLPTYLKRGEFKV